MSPNAPLNILVVDDHALVREAFTTHAEGGVSHSKVVSAGTCAEAMVGARQA
jgi:CheY-like chemotaxis protein